MTNLWVDDEREAPFSEGWVVARSASDAIAVLEAEPPFSVISLDYSLGGSDWDNNGGTVLQWLRDHPEKWPTEEIRCHSSSSSGRGLLERMVNDYKPAGWTGTMPTVPYYPVARCRICSLPGGLTGTGKLYPLTVQGPKKTYTYQICDECVPLFNTNRWARTVKALRAMKTRNPVDSLKSYLVDGYRPSWRDFL